MHNSTHSCSNVPTPDKKQPPIEVWEEKVQNSLNKLTEGLLAVEVRLAPVSRSFDIPSNEAPVESAECDLHATFNRLLSRVESSNYLLSRIHQNLCL